MSKNNIKHVYHTTLDEKQDLMEMIVHFEDDSDFKNIIKYIDDMLQEAFEEGRKQNV